MQSSADGQADAVVVRLDLAAGRRGRGLDSLRAAVGGLRAASGSWPATRRPAAPTRRNAPGALPPSQMSSGLAGRGPTLADSTREELAVKRDVVLAEQQPQQGQGLVEHRGRGGRAGPGRPPVPPAPGWLQAEHRQHPAGGPAPARVASCLATRTGWRPGSTATPVPTFSWEVRASAWAMPMNGSTSEP